MIDPYVDVPYPADQQENRDSIFLLAGIVTAAELHARNSPNWCSSFTASSLKGSASSLDHPNSENPGGHSISRWRSLPADGRSARSRHSSATSYYWHWKIHRDAFKAAFAPSTVATSRRTGCTCSPR